MTTDTIAALLSLLVFTVIACLICKNVSEQDEWIEHMSDIDEEEGDA